MAQIYISAKAEATETDTGLRPNVVSTHVYRKKKLMPNTTNETDSANAFCSLKQLFVRQR